MTLTVHLVVHDPANSLNMILYWKEYLNFFVSRYISYTQVSHLLLYTELRPTQGLVSLGLTICWDEFNHLRNSGKSRKEKLEFSWRNVSTRFIMPTDDWKLTTFV